MKMNTKTISLILLTVLISAFLSAGFSVSAKSNTPYPVPARVTTYGTRDTTATSINLRGYVSNDGGCADMYTWFEYGNDINYGNDTNPEPQNGIGYFSDDISDLLPCTTYHFRAVARNNTLEEGYGSDKTFQTSCASFDTKMAFKNVTKGDTIWYETRGVEPGDDLLFRVNVFSTGNLLVRNPITIATLPIGISYENDLKIDGVSNYLNIVLGGVNIDKLFPNQTKSITFKAKVGPAGSFNPGRTNLFPSVITYNAGFSAEDTTQVAVNRKGVAGASTVVTEVPTGVAGDIFNSILIPLILAIVLIWIFKSKLIGFDKWADERKAKVVQHRAKRKLCKKTDWNDGPKKPRWTKVK
ncbi:MAG: hypothetical protein HQ539_01995 [Parcubacteria group bacterium]|nr:hypothetical protein [Parcubacteria group bacterium]